MYFLRRFTLVMLGLVLSAPFAARAEEAVAVSEAPAEEVPADPGLEPVPEAGPDAAAEAPPAEPPAEAPAAEAPAEPPAEAPAAEAPAEAPAPAAEAPAPSEGGYTVVKGDTLWDLAARYYQDPYKWGRIWEANREAIRNPNLIYPDQTFSIPGADVAASAPAAESPAESPAAEAPAEEAPVAEAPAAEAPAQPEAVVEEAQAAAPEETVAAAPEAAPEAEPVAPTAVPKKKPSRYVPTDVGSDVFIVNADWEADGYVLRDDQNKLMIAQDDVVYVNVGAANGAKPYMRGGIYRKGGHIKDPDTRDHLGYVMRRIGTFQLTENVGDQASSAVVTSSKEPIRSGDIVRLENN